jgi:hypothetical protein
MRIIFVLAALLFLAGCETYAVGGTVPADKVRVHVGVSTYDYYDYYDRYRYYQRPVIVHRHVHQPPVIVVHKHKHKKRHYDRHYDRRDHRRDHRRDRDRRHHKK